MKKQILNATLILGLISFSSCDMVKKLEHRASVINNYENVALQLSKENRDLKFEIARLKSDIEAIKAKNNFLKIQLDRNSGKKGVSGRGLASVAPALGNHKKNDLVKFDIYKWTPSQILGMAEKEFESKNFEKSAQFFEAFSQNFPTHKRIDDQFLFQAGVASFESGDHPDWTLKHLEHLVEKYPTSKFYRGAKLWMALTYLKIGNKGRFFSTVEEFRKKYRNTPEWKVLSQHYEKIVQKYK